MSIERPNYSVSKLTIALVAGEGFTDAEINSAAKRIIACNTKPNGTINLSTGVITATGEIAEIIMKEEAIDGGGIHYAYSALIIPQTLNSELIVKIILNNVEYTATEPVSNLTVIKAGYHYQYNVTLKKSNNNESLSVDIE